MKYKAWDLLSQPNARLIQINSGVGSEYFIGSEKINSIIATKIIAHPDVIGCHDGLFAGCHQSWMLASVA